MTLYFEDFEDVLKWLNEHGEVKEIEIKRLEDERYKVEVEGVEPVKRVRFMGC